MAQLTGADCDAKSQILRLLSTAYDMAIFAQTSRGGEFLPREGFLGTPTRPTLHAAGIMVKAAIQRNHR